MACKHLNAVRIIRHDRLVQLIARVARHCGVVTQLEPRIDGEDRSRGDGHLFFHAQTALFDTIVVDPCAAIYLKAAQHALGAASAGEHRKSSIYSARCAQQDIRFYPVALECHGGLGAHCRDLVSRIAEEGELNGIKLMHGMKSNTFLLRALSFSLQYGNAMLAIHGSKRSRKETRLIACVSLCVYLCVFDPLSTPVSCLY